MAFDINSFNAIISAVKLMTNIGKLLETQIVQRYSFSLYNKYLTQWLCKN